MMKKEEYLSLLSPQIVELFNLSINNKEVALQKVCVLLITRISFLSPMICNEYLITPIVKPLLYSHTEDCNNGEDIVMNDNKERMMTTDDDDNQNNNYIDDKNKNPNILYKEESLVTAINALQALVTLCPLQPFLVTSLDISGVGAAAIRYKVLQVLFYFMII
jgi:hypothetical protein